ncbi:ThrRS/AlaRS common domain-containing protein [Aspergillus heterothallicus]
MISQAPTEALYLDNSSLHTSSTELISCQQVSSLDEDTKRLAKNIAPENFALVTRRTIFYAQGGGQPSDTGFITAEIRQGESGDSKFEVLLVRKTFDGTIYHFGRFLAGTGAESTGIIQQPSFAPNQSVSLAIDRKKRNHHSRLHTAGHILGLAIRLLRSQLDVREKGKANHFPGEASLEFEGLLYNEHKPIIQEKVNELVAQAIPVRTCWWEAAEIKERIHELNMAEGMQDAVGGMGRVRIAEIGDLDANPCGGTHVENTGKTGEIRIRKISRQKGVTKVSYEVPVNFDL